MKAKTFLVLLLVFVSPGLGFAMGRVPVVFDTDIGTDIDDTWALAQILRSPELDLKLVLSDSGDTRYRAKIAAKFLQVCGRTDIPVGVGFNRGPMGEDVMNQLPWVKDYDLKAYPGTVHEDGIAALIALIMQSKETITVIAVGPCPNIRLALEREPRIAAKCRFVGMYGSFRIGYGGDPKPVPEANVRVDPAALRAVLAAPWQDVLLTPLDTCGLVSISGEDYRKIWCSMDDPMLRALIENYCHFAGRVTWMNCNWFTQSSTTLFDSVAVTLAHDETPFSIETVSFDVTDDGYTVLSPTGAFKARSAMQWVDRPAWEHQLAQRLLRTTK
ncbi:nucleoside hydrolase [Nibricoccus sp. IMCC34717]|uniref:nucleoside hydrolase n=1 Tax=Nibricoccus sp. IMCC34717 TaxID=3034021 RepID=UPI00384DCCF9